MKSQYDEEKRKQERMSQQEDVQRREDKLGEAKRITIKEDTLLPIAEVVRSFISFLLTLQRIYFFYKIR